MVQVNNCKCERNMLEMTYFAEQPEYYDLYAKNYCHVFISEMLVSVDTKLTDIMH